MKWTLLALRREPLPGAATVSTYTAPVNHSLGPVAVPLVFLVICIGCSLLMVSISDQVFPSNLRSTPRQSRKVHRA